MSLDKKVELTKEQKKLLRDCQRDGTYAVDYDGHYFCTGPRSLPCEYRTLIPDSEGAGANCNNPKLLEPSEKCQPYQHDNDIPYFCGD